MRMVCFLRISALSLTPIGPRLSYVSPPTPCIAASADLRVANGTAVADTDQPIRSCPRHHPIMQRTQSKPMAALWMAGWLALMLVMAVAGREAVRELNVFQLM